MKVGMSATVASRLSSIRTNMPYTMELVGRYCISREKMREAEKLAHQVLKEHRTQGEWFKCDADMACVYVKQAVETIRKERRVRRRYRKVATMSAVEIAEWRQANSLRSVP